MFRPKTNTSEYMFHTGMSNKNSNIPTNLMHNHSSYYNSNISINKEVLDRKQTLEFMNTTPKYLAPQHSNVSTREPLKPISLNSNYYGNVGTHNNHIKINNPTTISNTSYNQAIISEPGPSGAFFSNSNNLYQSLDAKGQDNKVEKLKNHVNNTLPSRKGNENIRIFTGTPEKIMKWHKLYKNYFCFYEVIGSIVSIQEGTVRLQKIMLLRDKKGPILQLVHYVHDHIVIENFFVGQMLRCVGRMIGNNIMHGLSIREAKPDEITALQRMCYISDHAITKSKKN